MSEYMCFDFLRVLRGILLKTSRQIATSPESLLVVNSKSDHMQVDGWQHSRLKQNAVTRGTSQKMTKNKSTLSKRNVRVFKNKLFLKTLPRALTPLFTCPSRHGRNVKEPLPGGTSCNSKTCQSLLRTDMPESPSIGCHLSEMFRCQIFTALYSNFCVSAFDKKCGSRPKVSQDGLSLSHGH